jgi:hypothetical protein
MKNLTLRGCMAALALGAAAGLAASQLYAQTAPKAQAPVVKNPGRVYYDYYQASHRLRLRRESCMRDEDLAAQYCVKKCRAGYLATNAGVPRQCRSEKPLPPGQLPVGGQVQRGIPVGPIAPTKPVPGR